MSELATAIESACDVLRAALDDDWSETMDKEVMAIVDEFDLDPEWVEEQIKLALWS